MQGFNMGRYVPPDHEGTSTSGNKLHRRRAPGVVDPKTGTQTVRFELPFALWCHTCNPHALLAQGTRFNAEKRRVGWYYSTAVWAFRVKHAACGGAVEVRTQPERAGYVVHEGGRERDYGDDAVGIGQGGREVLTAGEREEAREGAFERLEGRVGREKAVESEGMRVERMRKGRERDWRDPGEANRRLRAGARKERKVAKREAERDEGIREKFGFGGELVRESEVDARRAMLVSFGEGGDGVEKSRDAEEKVMFRAEGKIPVRARSGPDKKGKEKHADALRRQILSNTRASLNPF